MSKRPLVAIDVTPILSGSENGGAKGFVLALLEGFLQRGRHRYLLLTTPANHDNFAALERAGMTRLCVTDGVVPKAPRKRFLERLLGGPRNGFRQGSLGGRGVELLFCPMTDPAHAEPGVPIVSTAYDLQHLEYPSFFTAAERATRDAFLSRMRRAANLVVCISEFTRGEVIERLGMAPERVRAIPIAIQSRLILPSDQAVGEMRARLGIGDAPYAFYPANGWAHKNHRLLLIGFAHLIRERPDLLLHLVLSGNLLELAQDLQLAITQMGLEKRIHLVGYVSNEDLAALWRGAYCLLFPSLYEGFGIPLLEAMQFGTPIVCSRLASLSEVAGDAAIYIDPRHPAEIGSALKELFDNPEGRSALVERGGRRLQTFQTGDMVDRYLDVLDEVLAGGGYSLPASVEGVFSDRWVGPVFTAEAGTSSGGRVWELEMHLPNWLPHPTATVRADLNGRKVQKLKLLSGQSSRLKINVPPAGGHLRLEVTPSFVPHAHGDHRELTLQLVRCQLRDVKTGEIVHEV
jgi:glycosyltransferase involved in cell wall biosynthesis